MSPTGGLNSKPNIDALVKLGSDYVLSSRIRGASEDIKRQVLDPEGRRLMKKVNEDGEMVDNGWFRELTVEEPTSYEPVAYALESGDQHKLDELNQQLNHQMTKSGKKVTSTLKRRYIVTWTESRAAKDQRDRQRLVGQTQRDQI